MYSKVFILGTICFLSGCVTVKAPDNLVSDTVKVGKNVYNTIKDKVSTTEPKSTSELTVFEHNYIIPEGEELSVSNKKCLEQVTVKAKEKLNKFRLDIKQIESSINHNDGNSSLACKISI